MPSALIQFAFFRLPISTLGSGLNPPLAQSKSMPEFFSVPPVVQHQRVEIIIWPLEWQAVQGSFKEVLAAMPDIGYRQ